MPVVVPLKHEPLVDAVDHFASLLVGGVETQVHQDDETVQGNQQASVLVGAAPASGGLEGEKLGSPTFGCHTRALGCNRVRRFIGKVFHDLPADGRIRIEEPFEVRRAGGVVV